MLAFVQRATSKSRGKSPVLVKNGHIRIALNATILIKKGRLNVVGVIQAANSRQNRSSHSDQVRLLNYRNVNNKRIVPQ